ncbi:AbiH family protein [Zobellia sp. B3R18]|uniref:AbiH family protein n=1 Tax=Zobellia sp. B3R18 TaxID=2841568 RepID=UPI001C064AC0|nr:AbiH family protein [Zobellia sp. B3R18]MBU2974269.1 bacteriophage abortive infection AbiH family protein [Zobellia sp. B3R18]
MQILFILGNGFDLNLNLDTSYASFYKYYESVKSNNKNINKLKKDISNRLENWSDLEIELGQYTNELTSIDEFDDIMNDIGERLAKFLAAAENKLDIEKVNKEKFFDYLCFPEKLFLPSDKEKIISYKNKWPNHQWETNIFTFNYTTVIEKILGDTQRNVVLGYHGNKVAIKLTQIKHIHGFLDKDMVMGVNDISQIGNKSFCENVDILESLVKSQCNEANRNNIDRQFVTKIKSAHLICIFGSSIGETDKKWWQQIGDRLKQDVRLIIFTLGNEIQPRTRYLSARIERNIKEHFLSKTKLTEAEKKLVREKIFIGLNTQMFSGLIINEKSA